MNPDQVRQRVSETYAAAVQRPKGSCCGAGAVTTHPALATGYTADRLAPLPTDAVQNSFGCGDPLAFAEVQPGQTVVDLGSGAGIDCLIAARAVGPQGRVIGVDMTSAMLDRARANARQAGFDNIEFRSGLIEQLPVADASADWIISNCVINLSPQKRRVFDEIARVLKPGGRAQISDMVADDLPWAARHLASLYDNCVAGAISEAEYVEAMRAAGLEDIRVLSRHTYDAAQLCGLADGGCVSIPRWIRPFTKRLAGSLAGRIHSIRITARKPEVTH